MTPDEVVLHAGKRVRDTVQGISGYLGSLWVGRYAEIYTGEMTVTMVEIERVVLDDSPYGEVAVGLSVRDAASVDSRRSPLL